MKKLLSRSLTVFSLYAFFVLLCSIPVYYFIVDNIWQREIQEHNKLFATATSNNIIRLYQNGNTLQRDINTWNLLQPHAIIRPAATLKADSLYQRIENHSRFQGLITWFAVDGKAYSLAVETNQDETHDTMMAITLATIVFFLLLLAGFIILNRWVSGWLWQPFYHSLEKVTDFDLNDRKPILPEKTDIEEFDALNESLHKLTMNNVMIYQQQREFTENAAYELQTPLAIVESRLDLLLQYQPLTAEQSDLVEDAVKALMRVTHISRNLLLLTKIENDEFVFSEIIDLSTLIAESTDPLIDLFSFKELFINQQIQADVVVEGNRILLEILFNNLLLNAAKYTPEEGILNIRLAPHYFRISNSGTEALDQDKLFRRFVTVSRQTGGSGLGLTLVKQICHRYRWRITYGFQEQMHHFTIHF
ncbi:sensor histidine kinase [Chitinophaga solisilvae]|uniref:sensor histidine kinase n=1 Tax=Chitinophaga solisilvae TaxID=1233460 RepID=UPI00136F656F|nr:HAMP domain-containing sensor histidine kinase [Chitinophaga solisilvae]